MSKKSSKRKTFSSGTGIKESGPLPFVAWKIIFSAIIPIMIGYILLTKADPAGENFYSVITPFFLIGGHILIIWGILCPSDNSK